MEKKTVSIVEMGHILGVSSPVAYELAHSGKIRTIIVGKRLLVPLSAIDEFLSSNVKSVNERFGTTDINIKKKKGS